MKDHQARVATVKYLPGKEKGEFQNELLRQMSSIDEEEDEDYLDENDLRAVSIADPLKPNVERASCGAWFALALLFFINLSSQWQRFAIAYAKGFEASDEQTKSQDGEGFYEIDKAYSELHKYYGVLSGPAFLLPMATCGIFMGLLTDRFSRKWLLIICCFTWSAATWATGHFNESFGALVVCRIILGLA